MALFSNTSTTNGRSEAARQRRTDGNGSLSIVASDLHITGDLVAEGVIKVEGRVTGAVRAGQQVLVAPGAVIEGDIETTEAVIGGEVRGNILAADRVELQASSVVHGNLRARRLLIHEGGTVNGEVNMEPTDVPRDPASSVGHLT